MADHLQVPKRTLQQWRYLGTGPAFIKCGHHVRYRWSDIERWINEQSAGGSGAA